MTTSLRASAPLETADVETSSEEYAGRFAGAVGAWFLAIQTAATLELLAPHRPSTVLDVGGGHGQVTGPLLEHGYRVTVLGSADACRRGIQRFLDAGGCTFQTGDLLALPYPDRQFDVVLSYRLLPHVTRWRCFLRELGRVARRTVLLDYPVRSSLNCLAPWLFGLKKRVEGNTRTFALFDERDVVRVLAPDSFAPVGRRPQFFLPMALHRALGAPRLSAGAEHVARRLGLTRAFGSPVILRLDRRGA
ncbi:MAG TPA: class I SAM-dependent methyltransferase [Candidatus Tectomicrobia bacterium]|nr:class I SAM-dependent methyltransferase [Candidatus Tectomicrobia bacterium]